MNDKQQRLNRMQEEINFIKENEEKKILSLEVQYKSRELLSKKLHSISNRNFLENINKDLLDISIKDSKLERIIKLFNEPSSLTF